MTRPPSTAPLMKKRLDLRSPSKHRAKPVIPAVKWIVGDDFWAVLPEARRLLEQALKPKAGGRPRKFQMPGGAA